MTTPIALASGVSLAPKPTDQAGLKKAAQAFEAVFLRQMISSMRSASLGEDILGSTAGDQFRDMADARTADSMAEKGALGIAEMLLTQFAPKPVATAIATLSKDSDGPAVETGK
ncbi:flagellar protein FlgJ [Sphingomonas laterariae]|uniref:Flagellar protein FlgJ n=1 Tax=Edaphosphingomonas laterariae TaxID=861865 RepID=A0A239HVU0_9SPHN|nr:rod-binding protein [Sphingomonas laterariae]SNS84294.1 flagellar protein FlgJ [Sphingomonas laterariae]